MLAILDPAVKRATPSRAQTLVLTLGLGALSLTIAAVAPARRATPPSPPSPVTVRQEVAGDSAVPRQTQPVSQRQVSTAQTSRAQVAAQLPDRSDAADAAKQGLKDPSKGWLRAQVFGTQSGAQPPDTALLGRILRTDKDADVRKAAAWALQSRRDGVPLLLERLRVDEDGSVREMSAWALSGMGSTEVAAALAEALRHDKSGEVRVTSAWGLGHMGGMADLTALEGALDDSDPDVRQRALWALGQHQLQSAPSRVVALLKDDREEVRLMAAWVLGGILDKATIPALHDAFLKERDAEVMEAEFRALAFMGDRTIIEPALKSEKPELRARAVQMLAGRGPGVWPWPWPWPEPRPEP